MSSCPFSSSDPFRAKRSAEGVLVSQFQGKDIPLILRHKDVRAAAADWARFSSDAPFRVPIPSEEDVRSVRQLPVETNPPDHGDYRRIIDPFFRRPKEPEMMQQVNDLIGGLVADAAARPEIEVVRQFALPLQSRALAYLLNVPQSDAEEWISWGIHVFRDGPNGEAKGQMLERYIHQQLDRALEHPGDDFYSALHRAEFRGRKLTREEQVGFVNLTFAGGRDTIIQTVASLIHHLAVAPEDFAQLRAEPNLHLPAVEEFFRLLSPLTITARVCPAPTEVKGHLVAADERVALCWASANRDETVFPEPDNVQLDRKPNPHIAFGSGPHTCIGAHHARLVARTLLRQLCEQIERIEVLASEAHVEREQAYQRTVGFSSLTVRLHRRSTGA